MLHEKSVKIFNFNRVLWGNKKESFKTNQILRDVREENDNEVIHAHVLFIHRLHKKLIY